MQTKGWWYVVCVPYVCKVNRSARVGWPSMSERAAAVETAPAVV